GVDAHAELAATAFTQRETSLDAHGKQDEGTQRVEITKLHVRIGMHGPGCADRDLIVRASLRGTNANQRLLHPLEVAPSCTICVTLLTVRALHCAKTTRQHCNARLQAATFLRCLQGCRTILHQPCTRYGTLLRRLVRTCLRVLLDGLRMSGL